MGPGGKKQEERRRWGEDTRGKSRPCAHLPFLTLNEGGLVWQPLWCWVGEMGQQTDMGVGRDATGEIIRVIATIYLTDEEFRESQRG